MAELLTFMEQALGCAVPAECRAWLSGHVDPEHALDESHAVHLLWLSSRYQVRTAAEAEAVLGARVALRDAYEVTQREPSHPTAGGVLAEATGRLRGALWATPWWDDLVTRWDARQSRGLGVVRYEVRNGAATSRVRGTHVGCFAVREVRWPDFGGGRCPPLRHLEQTPDRRRKRQGPRHVYAVDLVRTGQSLGSFASAAVAFEVADRFGRRGVRTGPVPRALQRLLDTYRGSPPSLRARSWPAEPHWRFGTCRRRTWGGRVGQPRRVPRRREVRHGR